MARKIPAGTFAFMILAFAVYALTGVFSKMASAFAAFSSPYLIFLGGAVAVLGVYAVMWQIILKRLPLSTAFLWKNVCILFSLLYSHFIFNEQITTNNLIGMAIIITGLCLISGEQ